MIFLFLVCALFFFVGCDYIQDPIPPEPKLVAQKPPEASVRVDLGEHQTIRTIQEKITPIIDAIIHEELKKIPGALKHDIPKFIRNPKCHFTLFYLGHIEEKSEPVLVNSLKRMQASGVGNGQIRDIEFSDQADFFGDTREELVIKIHDTHNDITKLHNDIRQAFIKANNTHKLFSLKYSDRYQFIPHVTLGKILGNAICAYAQAAGADGDLVFETIKQKILYEITKLLKNFEWDKKISVQNFQIYGGSGKLLQNFSLL